MKLSVDEDFKMRRYDARTYFTPAAPIRESELFSGRSSSVTKIIEAVLEPGRHIILYGEMGVGKTSITGLISSFIANLNDRIKLTRIQADPTDDFSSLWRKLFKEIVIRDNNDNVSLLSKYYEKDIFPDDVRRELELNYKASDIPIIVIDEYDKVSSPDINLKMANTIKSLSDFGISATIIVVGVAENISELIGEHLSIQRCLEQITLPRMDNFERHEVLNKILPKLGMTIEDEAAQEIARLSHGLPSYIHSLGLHSTLIACDRHSMIISLDDVRQAIKMVIEKSSETLSSNYAKATYSNRSESLYSEVLLACALAKANERGYFSPNAVCEPLTSILGKEELVKLALLQPHLKKFTSDEAHHILVKIGKERQYQFRFRDPMMQPYVIMRGLYK
jgi:hypothetical protein